MMAASSGTRIRCCRIAVACAVWLAAIILPSRTLLADAVQWVVDTDGYWHNAPHWSSNPNLPGSADNVTVDRSGVVIRVTHSQGADTVSSLTCNSALTVSGGALSVTGVAQTNGDFAVASGGTVSFNGAALLAGTSALSGGMLSGSGTATVAAGSTLNWTLGTMSGSGITAIAPGATLNVGNPTTQFVRLARTINNAGTTVLAGARGIYCLSGGSEPKINNQIGGTFDAQSDVGLGSFDDTTGTLSNAGTFKKSSGTGTSSITADWSFDNSGLVQARSGTLSVAGPFNNTGTAEANGGAITITGPVSQLFGTTLSGGTWVARSNSTLNLAIGGNIVTNRGNVTLDGLGSKFDKINTLADNQGSFSIQNGRNFATGGNLSSSGALTVGAGSTLSVAGDLNVPTTGTLNVTGTAILKGSGTNTLAGGLQVAAGGRLQKIGTGSLVISGPQHWGAGSVFQIGSNQSSPEEGFSSPSTNVPEPGTVSLLILGMLCLMVYARWRR